MQIKGYDSEVAVTVSTAVAFPGGARFVAHARERADSAATLLELSTDAGTITLGTAVAVTGGFETEMRLKFAGTLTKTMVPNTIFMDVARVDVSPAEHLGFRLSIDWTQPITRLP